MANYGNLKTAIQQVIYENGNQEITGSVMQATLLAMVNSLGAGYQFIGIATPSTNPGTPDQNVFYLAATAGTYVNFGNIVLDENEVAILRYNGSWTKEASGFASAEKVNQLDQKLGALTEGQFVISPNLFDKTVVTTGKGVRKDLGTLYTNADFCVSDYIPIPNGAASLYYSPDQSYAGVIGWAFYNASKVFTHGGAGRTPGVQEGDAYFRFSVRATLLDTTMLIAGTSADLPDHYVPYGTIANFSLKDGIVETSKIADEAITLEKMSESAKAAFATTSQGMKVVGSHYDVNDFDVYQVATGSDVESPTGNRLRIVKFIPALCTISGACTAGKGIAASMYATLSDALKAGTNYLATFSSNIYVSEFDGVSPFDGYLVLSLCKSDSSAFSAQDKADFIAATTVSVKKNGLIDYVGQGYGKEDAHILRKRTSDSTDVDDADGVRIRVILPVKTGMKVFLGTTDPNGLNCGVWDSLNSAIRASASTGFLQVISAGYTSDFKEVIITENGYMTISLTDGGRVITDARKQELLDSLFFVVGFGLSQFVPAMAKTIEIKEAPKKYSYIGERVRLENTFEWGKFATNGMAGQSSARYGDYLFIVKDLLTNIACYNLKTKTLLYTLTTGLSSETYWHCNQASFGKHFYDSSDMFPVLYISMQNDGDGKCSALGFRIVPVLNNGEISSFTVTLVQTIKLPAMTDDNCLGNVNIAFDLQEGFMWGYGRNNNSSAANYNKARFTKFAIPDLFDGNNDVISLVELTDADILDAFSDDWSMYNAQGGFIQSGKLVIMQGYQNAGYIYCRVIDLYFLQKQITFIDLLKNNFTEEPEGVFFYDGKIMTSANSVNIFFLEIS